MIKNYIFDFGNVLARYEPNELTAVHVHDKDALRMISDVVFDRLYWDALDVGTITDQEVKDGICSRLPKKWHDAACRVYDDWIVSMPPIPGMRDVVVEAKTRGGKIYLLSNISIGFAEHYADSPYIKELFTHFDGLVFSGPIGLAKPNASIFEHILNRFDLQADECLFIDDNASNIATAEALGIHGYLFDGNADKLKKTLFKETL